MAYGYANVGATELANLALDKPLLGANVIPRSPSLERWNTSAGGADQTATGYPIHRLRDADVELVSKPSGTQAQWYLEFNFGTTVDVDFVAIAPGHNLGTLAVTTLDIEFDQDQDGAFTGLDTCALAASLPLSNDDRIIQLDLDPAAVGTPQRFSDVQYCRISIAKGGGMDPPNITELIIGARCQLPRWPNIPFNPDNLGDVGELGEPTKGGVIDQYLTAENQFVLDAEWKLKNEETSELRAWWKKTRGSFIWVWQPSSAPANYHFMSRDSARLTLPFYGWQKHTFELLATEQGPEAKYLENE